MHLPCSRPCTNTSKQGKVITWYSTLNWFPPGPPFLHPPSTDGQAGELVCFDSGVKGMALNLQSDHVGIVVFGADTDIHQGDLVYRTGQIVNVPIGPGNLGRVLDALGQPIDGKGPLTNVRSSLVEVKAPGECDEHWGVP